MVLRGFCETQNKKYAIEIKAIPCATLEDDSPKYEYGKIECEYASYGGVCDSKNCSILKQHGIKR